MNPALLSHLGDLKLRELEVFFYAGRIKSIREVARRMKTTPGQVSKIIKKIESKTKERLFVRSSSGVVPTDAGKEFLQHVEPIMAKAYQMESMQLHEHRKSLSIAATSFLITYVVASLAAKTLAKYPTYNLRFQDISPDQLVAQGLRGAFDIAFHFGRLDWPNTWQTRLLTRVGWVLCARKAHPLSLKPARQDVLQYPFVTPTYWTSEGLQRGNDYFEVPIGKRLPGYETSTADAAIPILQCTDQLAFLPELLVQPFVNEGSLKILRMKDAKRTEHDLYISVKADVVPEMVFKSLLAIHTD